MSGGDTSLSGAGMSVAGGRIVDGVGYGAEGFWTWGRPAGSDG
jgi:hypothetical protein